MPRRFLVWFMVAALPAWAGKELPPAPDPAVQAAEHQRLADELQRLVARQVWVGAEEKYRACEALGYPLEFRDLLNGAYAARGLGDMASAYARLKQAATLQASREVVDWLWALDTTYGKVVLTTNPPKPVKLRVDSMPFAPDQRAAVEFAIARLLEDGSFDGLLPSGWYALGNAPFKVVPGVTVQIEASTKKPRNRDVRAQEPPPAPADEGRQP